MKKNKNIDTVKNGFVFFESYFSAIKLLPENERGNFALAIIEYMFNNKEPDFQEESLPHLVWNIINPNLLSSKSHANRGQGRKKGIRNGPNDLSAGNHKQLTEDEIV